MNRFELIGNLGQDPEIRTLNDGARVANLSIATEARSYTDSKTGERVNPGPNWHRVSVYIGATVDWIEKNVRKGDLIRVQGSLRDKSYEKDGETRYAVERVVNNSREGHEVQGLHLRSRTQGE